ncbi:flagellar biosynthetic protein FliO [Desulfitispora alkaliphila]|uniref:flagellar biosynthetic protein FliO n=1 Tax=Desulfitispora alkaliphila TaxID=622674 RepID=UPI003D23087C
MTTTNNGNSVYLRFVLCILLFFVMITPVGAEPDNNLNLSPPAYEEPEMGTGDFAIQLIKVILGLIIVLALLMLLLRFIKKNQRAFSSGHIKVLDFTSLGANKGIAIVKVGSKTLVLGVTDNNITQITELEGEEASLLDLEVDDGENIDMGMSFHHQLKNTISRLNSNMNKKGGNNDQ